jgi:hypothetical protein
MTNEEKKQAAVNEIDAIETMEELRKFLKSEMENEKYLDFDDAFDTLEYTLANPSGLMKAKVLLKTAVSLYIYR